MISDEAVPSKLRTLQDQIRKGRTPLSALNPCWLPAAGCVLFCYRTHWNVRSQRVLVKKLGKTETMSHALPSMERLGS